MIFLFVFVSVASCRSQSIVQQECQCTVSCWSMQFACAWHYTAVCLATTLNLFLPRDIVVTLHRMRAHTTLWSFLMPHCTPVRPRVATPGGMNMHFLPVSPDPSVLPIPTATAHPNLPQLGCITASSDAVYSSTKSVNTGSAMAANKSVRTVRGPPNTPLLHACGPPCPSRRRQSSLTLLHGQC